MFSGLLVCFILISTADAYVVNNCQECLTVVRDIKNHTLLLNDTEKICHILNLTKCQEYIKDINTESAIDICQKIGYCEKLSMKHALFTTFGNGGGGVGGFAANVSLSSTCKLYYPYISTVNMGVTYFKYYNTFIAMYDANGYDADNCYKHISNNGIYNLTKIWEVVLDSDFEVSDDNYPSSNPFATYYCNNTVPFLTHTKLFIVTIPLMTDKYRYYILPDGSIFKKIKIEKLYRNVMPPYTGAFAINNYNTSGGYISQCSPKYNNASLLHSDTGIYTVQYIAKMIPHISYSAYGAEDGLCMADDIIIKKVYEF